MKYPLSYWNKGDLVVLQSEQEGLLSSALYHFRNHLFIYMKPYVAQPDDVAVLYCINDGTIVFIHATYLREPKKKNET